MKVQPVTFLLNKHMGGMILNLMSRDGQIVNLMFEANSHLVE